VSESQGREHQRDQSGEARIVNQEESSQPRQLRIALAQLAPILGARSQNLDVHFSQIDAARDANADLVVFPELSLTGYFLRDMVPDVALSRSSPEIAELAAHAADVDCVFGFVEQSEDHRFYNSAAYVEDGQIRHVHRKVYLPTYGLFDEQRYFAAGHRIRAFGTARFGRVGVLVCEDAWHLSAAGIMQAEQVDLLILIANSPARGVRGNKIGTAAIYRHICQAYAVLLGAIVVMVNRVGFEDGLCFWGGSMVVGPGGDVLGECPQLDPSLAVAEWDPADLRRERIITPLGRDERLLVTLEELKRIKRQRYED
jgi:predicted amidohydrolase